MARSHFCLFVSLRYVICINGYGCIMGKQARVKGHVRGLPGGKKGPPVRVPSYTRVTPSHYKARVKK